MTPKEKAEELINKYILNTPVGFHFDDAKQCALIAVAEILKNIQTLHWTDIKYWEDVETEINNI